MLHCVQLLHFMLCRGSTKAQVLITERCGFMLLNAWVMMLAQPAATTAAYARCCSDMGRCC